MWLHSIDRPNKSELNRMSTSAKIGLKIRNLKKAIMIRSQRISSKIEESTQPNQSC